MTNNIFLGVERVKSYYSMEILCKVCMVCELEDKTGLLLTV